MADIKIAVLHKHWLHADSINARMRASVREAKEAGISPDVLHFAESHSLFLALSVWYALLYVVVEGYCELKLKDKKIDALLLNETNVQLLRRFRNAIFHYQQEPFSEKLLGFLQEKDTEKWMRDLNLAFKLYFERELKIEELMEEVAAIDDDLPLLHKFLQKLFGKHYR